MTNNSQSLNQVSLFYAQTYSSSSQVRVRIEDHWVAPYGNHPAHIVLSKDRYWNIEGNMDAANPISFKMFFNGANSGYFYDTNLQNFVGSSFSDDSLVIMYRPTPNDTWQVYQDVIFNTLGSSTDGYASFDVENLSASGQFTFGYKLYTVGVNEIKSTNQITIYPNPVKNELKITNLATKNSQVLTYTIYNEQGQTIQNGYYNPLYQSSIKVSNLPRGAYIIKLSNSEIEFKQKFIKE